MRYLIFFLSLVAFGACHNERFFEEVSFEDPEFRLVGEINVDSTIHVAVSKVFLPKKGETSEKGFVEEGIVTVESVTTGLITELHTKDRFLYENDTFRLIPNHEYNVTIQVPDNEVLKASFRMLKKVKVDSFSYEVVGDLVSLKIGFSDELDFINYYNLSFGFYVYPEDEFKECRTFGFFTDKCFDGEEVVLDIFIPKDDFFASDSLEVSLAHFNRSQFERFLQGSSLIIEDVILPVFESDFDQGLGKIYIKQIEDVDFLIN